MADRSLGPGPRTGLQGRASECALLDGLVAMLRRGESRSLVVRGEPGIGKTALLEYLVGAASDLTVVRAAGVESEIDLAYAGLHQVCAPMLDRLDRLPAPQRQALEIVFGLSVSGAPDRFLIGLGVMTLLSVVADEQPVLCIVDDAQWLDPASVRTLAFVARRLLAEPVGLVFAVREPDEDLRHIPELEVRGLHDGDARALLDSALLSALDERVRDRIIAETRGNPLALLELSLGLTAQELAGGFGTPAAHAVSGHTEETIVERLDALPAEARLLLLVAAIDPVGDPLLLVRACEQLGISMYAVQAETERMLAVGERVIFRDPLARSVVYRSASVEDRRAVHAALAEATDRQVDPDRRAWHLAAAAAGSDEDIARELEQSAGRARARGGIAAAAAFLHRAVALTGDAGRRADRALAAAEASLHAGAFDLARGLLATAQVGPIDERQLARLDLLRAQAAHAEGGSSEASALLLRAAQRLDPLDPQLARQTYLDAWSSALFAGGLASTASLSDVSREVRAARNPVDPARASDLLLDGFAHAVTDSRRTAAPLLEQAATRFAGDDVSKQELLRWGWLASASAVMVWDYETCLAVATRGVEVAREDGALTELAVNINGLTQAVALGGDFGRAAVLVAEADSVTEATGAKVALYGALVLAGFRGREPEASMLLDATIDESTAAGHGAAVQYARWARSLVLNGLGRYREAMAAAEQACDDTPELFVAVWASIELLEAATRSAEAGVADRALERLVAATGVAPTDWALGIEARSRALLSEEKTAERLYREAIELLGRTQLRPELARAHLLYGEWLRRENRRLDAHDQLRAAYEQLTSIGMEAFAERARAELLATGETVRKRRMRRGIRRRQSVQ